MHRTTLVLALILSVFLAVPGYATTEESVSVEPAQELLLEELNLTPMEPPMEPGVLDPGGSMLREQVRVCEEEDELQCAPGCCQWVRNDGTVVCFC